MTIATNEDGTMITLFPEGIVDSQQGEGLRAAVERALGEGKMRFIVNLQRIKHANSVGLGALVGLAREITGKGGRIALVGANETILDILKATRLDRRFAVFESTEQGMQSLKRGV